MSNLKFELNRAGVRELLQSQEMQTVLNEKASEIRNRCGDGYNQDTFVGRNRANAMVWPETFKARRQNKKHNILLKAVR